MTVKKSLLPSFLAILFVTAPLWAQVREDQEESYRSLFSKQVELASLSEQLMLLEPHVTFTPGRIAYLDIQAARRAGFSEEVIELAQEMMEVQNEALSALSERRPRNSIKLGPLGMNASGYDSLQRFLAIATEVDRAQGRGYLPPLEKAGATNACGTYDNPVPNVAGAWWLGVVAYKTKAAAEKEVIRQGFHKTAWYVGTSDYTQGRSYKSTWGTCSSPRFRNHGIITSKFKINTQYGECNPEVSSYTWPYWNWPSYCNWWHSTH